MADYQYDLLVIGAGPAGSEASAHGRRQAKRVAWVERNELGGTCLNYGCDPTDTLLQVAHLLYQARHLDKFGLQVEQATFDWDHVQSYVREVMTTIRGGTEKQAKEEIARMGIDYYQGDARFLSPHEIQVDDRVVSSDKIIIGTGVSVVPPAIPGLAQAGFITHVEAVSLPQLPHRMVIVGSVHMAIEFAQLFQRFGVRVTVLETGPHLLEAEDREMADKLTGILAEEGVRFETNVHFERVETGPKGKRLYIRCGNGGEDVIETDEIFVMTTRHPKLQPLNLEAAGVAYTERGITVDRTLRTTAPNIWAAGDVTGGRQFSNRASEQGKLAAYNAFSDHPKPFDEPLIPWIISTDPALTHVGKTEEQLRAENVPYRIGRMPLAKLDRAIMNDERRGLVKLLSDPEGHILGGHILARAAGDMIAPVVVALCTGQTVAQLADTILPYPTMTEAVRWAADMLK